MTTLLISFDSARTAKNPGALVGVWRRDCSELDELGPPIIAEYAEAECIVRASSLGAGIARWQKTAQDGVHTAFRRRRMGLPAHPVARSGTQGRFRASRGNTGLDSRTKVATGALLASYKIFRISGT